MMKGGTLKKMVIYRDVVAPSNGVRTQHEIRMTEVELEESEKQSGWINEEPKRLCCSTSGNTLTPCWRGR